MRKILIIVFVLIVTMSILWVFAGRQISEFVDRFQTAETKPEPVRSISYDRPEARGEFAIDVPPARLFVALAPLDPHIGTNKENQLALAYAEKVFAFGPLRSEDTETLAAEVPSEDTALLERSHSFLPWLQLADRSFRRHWYFRVIWTKPNGAGLKMLWGTKGGGDEVLGQTNVLDDSSLLPAKERTRLIRIEISDAAR
jgi:hypothetical protein